MSEAPSDDELYTLAGRLSDALAARDQMRLCEILMEAARAQGVDAVGGRAGMKRGAVYASLTRHGNPTLGVLLSVFHALGLRLYAYPIRGEPPPETVNIRRRGY